MIHALQNVYSEINGAFSEKAFFLKAFQGIHLAFVISQGSDLTPHTLVVFQQVLQALTKQHTTNGHGGKSLILFQDLPVVTQKLEPLFSSLASTLLRLRLDDAFYFDKAGPRRVPKVLWQPSKQTEQPHLVAVGLAADTLQKFEEKILDISLVLRMSRLVWVDAGGGMADATGQIMAFLNGSRLSDILRKDNVSSDPRWHLLKIFRLLLMGGVKAISFCRLADLDQELFTYQGCGSFFSQQPYCRVRRLGLDDFELAADIIRKGEQEGFLLARSEEAVSEVLAESYGAFILEGHLAGLCALKTAHYQSEKAGEIVSLYTLTRFQGTGVGVQLLRSLVRDAKRLGLRYLFACTQHEWVANFFTHSHFNHPWDGFHLVDTDQVPPKKWLGYDPNRKKQVICLRLDLTH